MSVLPGPFLSGFVPTPSLFLDVIPLVERSSAGKDPSGGPMETWATLYQNLVCLLCPMNALDTLLWRQRGMNVDHTIYFPVIAATGLLPQLGVRDRIFFGGAYLQVEAAKDEAGQGKLLTVQAQFVGRPG